MSNIYYLNSRNEKVDFVKDLPLLDIDDFFGSEFSSVTENNMIVSFSRGIKNYSIEGDVFVNTFDRITEIFDYDTYKNIQGRFYIGDYFIYCNVISSQSSDINIHRGKIKTSFTFTTDKSYWLKETKYVFEKFENSSSGLTYPFTYPFTYGASQGIRSIMNESLKESDFIMIVYGPVSNPAISIGNNIYIVNTDVTSQEYLVIDSRERKTYKVNNVGEHENMFANRGLGNSIFTKIKTGLNDVSWSGAFGFDLYVYNERSKPKWISSVQE